MSEQIGDNAGTRTCFSNRKEKEIDKAVQFIKAKCVDLSPLTVGIICGSGLHEIGSKVEEKVVIPYSEIPHFPETTGVDGHKKELICGKLGGKVVLCMLGRFHLYEGHSETKLIFPIRVMKLLGINVLVLTNAAGSLNKTYEVGDFVLTKDHICLPALGGHNPLKGSNDDRFGPRFPSMHEAYDKNLRLLMQECVEEMEIQKRFREGIYIMVAGPNYATHSELNFMKSIGADVIGMSTAIEVIGARHCGMRVLAMSLVTDKAFSDVDSDEMISHDIVLAEAKKNAPIMESLVTKFLQKLQV